MTYANLPAKKVAEACRLAKHEIDNKFRDHLEIVPKNHARLVAEGVWTEERAAKAKKDLEDFFEAGWYRDLHRVNAVWELATAAGDGLIAVDADDFQAIRRHSGGIFGGGS